MADHEIKSWSLSSEACFLNHYIITILKHFLQKSSQKPTNYPSRSPHLLKSKSFVNFPISPWEVPLRPSDPTLPTPLVTCQSSLSSTFNSWHPFLHVPLCSIACSDTPLWILCLLVEPGRSYFHKPRPKVALKEILTWKTTELVLLLTWFLSHWVVLGNLLISSMPQFAHFQIREMIQRV